MTTCATGTKVTWEMKSYELRSMKVGPYLHPFVRVHWTRTITCGPNDCTGPDIDGYGLTCSLPIQNHDRYLDYVLRTWRNPDLTVEQNKTLKQCMEDQEWGPYGVTRPHQTFEDCFTSAGLTLDMIIDPYILTKEPNVDYEPCDCVYLKFAENPKYRISDGEIFRLRKEIEADKALWMKHNIKSDRVQGIPRW